MGIYHLYQFLPRSARLNFSKRYNPKTSEDMIFMPWSSTVAHNVREMISQTRILFSCDKLLLDATVFLCIINKCLIQSLLVVRVEAKL